MAWTLLAHVTARSVDLNSITSAAIDTTGASLLVVILSDRDIVPATFSDSKGNTWVQRVRSLSGIQVASQIADVLVPTVGANHTFTATGVNSAPSFCVQAWSGSAVSANDQFTGVGTGGATSLQAGSITPVANGELLIAGFSNSDAVIGSLAINTGFTVGDVSPFAPGAAYGCAVATLVQTTAAAINPTWSWTSSVSAAAVIGSYKVPIAAPVVTSPVTVTGTVGQPFAYQIVATNTPTSYAAPGLPAGLSVNTTTGLLSGTPTTAAVTAVTISATNAGGTGSATLTITIVAAVVVRRGAAPSPTSLHPPPLRTPMLDRDGQPVESWRRYFLANQVFINQILTMLAATTTKPAVTWGEDPEWPEPWIPPVQTVPPPPVLAPGLTPPGLMWGDEAEWPEAWIPPVPPALPGPPGPPGPPGRDGEDPSDDAAWLVSVAGVVRSGQVGLASPVVVGLDNRVGLTGADGAPITLYTTTMANAIVRISADIFATAAVTGTATYTLAWTENATAQTMVVTATAVNTLGTQSNLIRPDNATAITAQLTGVFTGTFTVVGLAEQLA